MLRWCVMKKLALCFLLISSPLFAGEGRSPQQVLENYFEFFNNEDRASLNASSGEPFVFVIGGMPTAYPKYNDDDEVISTTDVVYLLVVRDGTWRVKGGFVNGNLTLGKD